MSRFSPRDILAHMEHSDYQPGRLKELARAMGVSQPEYREFRRTVKELERDGLLVRGRNNRYTLPDKIQQRVGILRRHPRGFGFVLGEGEEPDIYVPASGLRQAVDGDRVRVELLSRDDQGRGPSGLILEIVEQSARRFLGTFRWRGRRPVVEVDDSALGRDLYLDGEEVGTIEEGHKVLAAIRERGPAYDGLKGEIVEVLGDPEDPRMDFLSVVRRFDLPLEFPPGVLAEVEAMKLDIEGEVEGRRDLRGLCCMTIDPVDARDFDDAVSVEELAHGHWRLGVHIADVSHFVRPATALDSETLNRSTSVYLVDRVIHMLPEKLAADLCTLAPLVDRLAVSVLMELDRSGQPVEVEIVESVIRSRARLTYEQVQALFDGRLQEAGEAVPFAADLERLRQLSYLRRQIRRDRGSLDFDLPEARVQLDEEGHPLSLGRYPRYDSHRLIEEFMLLANECVGRFMGERHLPVLWRVHDEPDQGKLGEVADLVATSRFRPDPAEGMSPVQLQRLLAQVEGRKEAPLINKLVLQAMARAEYAPEDIGHFGLACRRYLHFTSPIRRYPDLLVHRVLKAALRGEWEEERSAAWRRQLPTFGRWTSRCERRAEEAERTYVKIKQMRYMEQFVGEQFPGLVSGILRGGFFVEVGEFMVDGFCFLRDLDEYFEYDEKRHRLTGRGSRRVIQLGTPVTVLISGVDWAAQEMDLVLVDEGRVKGGEKQSKKKKHRKKKKQARKSGRRKKR